MTNTSVNLSKKSNKRLLGPAIALVSIGLLLSQVAFPLTVRASNPQFNIFTPYTHTQAPDRDYYLLDVKNETKNSDWNFPVSADAGDTLVFYLYYHNATNGTIANNTTLRVSLPSGQNAQHTLTGYLWADNAGNATRSNPLSQTVQVNLSSVQNLEYISGSAKWYPNQADWRYDSPASFPGGQTGGMLFDTGINIGQVEGCWEFSGAIVFKMKVGQVQPNLTYDLIVSKTVRNLTAGQSSYSESVNAANNDRVMFQIQLQNTGNTALNNMFVRDALPSYLSYVSGSARVDGAVGSDALVSGGINIGSLNVSTSRYITFEAAVNIAGLSGSQTLTNTTYARADQVSEKNDTATVYVSQASGDLTVSKTVRNLTAGQSYFSESVNAQNNDRVMFQIQVTNNSTVTLNNLFVRDALPSYLSYIQGSIRIDGAYSADGLTSGGIITGHLNSGQTRTITFEATVNTGSLSSQTLTNTAYARADQVSEKNDTATVYISGQAGAYLNLAKYVRNLTAGQAGLLTSTNANAGDRVLFTLQVSALSGTSVYNVRVWDTLPSGLSYVSGSIRLDGAYSGDNLFSGGINLGTLSSGQTRTVTFEATVGSIYAGYVGSQTLTNYAYASGDGVSQRQASAQVIVGQAPFLTPTGTLTKKVVNLTTPNGTDTDNNAAVGDTLQYTITIRNNGPGVLNNVRLTDALPPYTTFQAADSGGSYNSATNQVTWLSGNLANGTSRSFTYRVTVQNVPSSDYVIRNTASGEADNLAAINSNEVRTTVSVGAVKGVVTVVTGSDNYSRNIAISILAALWSMMILYLLIEYGYLWRNWRLKLAVLKVRFKEYLS